MMSAAELRRRALRSVRHDHPHLWRYGLNAGPSLSYRLRRHDLVPAQARVIDELRRQGIARSSVTELGISAEFDRVVDALDGRWNLDDNDGPEGEKDFLEEVLGSTPVLDAGSPWGSLALALPLRAVADAHLGMFTQLRYYNAWRNRTATETPRSSQLWHRDREDLMILKVFVYLAGVDHDTGPVRYVPGTHSTGPRRLDPDWVDEDGVARATDESVDAVVPRSEWVEATGPAGTIVFADTTGLHCGGRLRSGERRMFTAMYTSRDSQAREWFVRNQTTVAPSDAEIRFALGAGRQGPAWVSPWSSR